MNQGTGMRSGTNSPGSGESEQDLSSPERQDSAKNNPTWSGERWAVIDGILNSSQLP